MISQRLVARKWLPPPGRERAEGIKMLLLALSMLFSGLSWQKPRSLSLPLATPASPAMTAPLLQKYNQVHGGGGGGAEGFFQTPASAREPCGESGWKV